MSGAGAPLFLGLDGGGSGCRARLEDAAGRRLGEGSGGPAALRLGAEAAFAALLAAARGAMAGAGIEETRDGSRLHVCAGLAGFSRDEALAAIRAMPHPFAALRFVSDAEIACAGAHGGADGGIVVAGTGSCAFARLGGAGFLLGGYGLPASDEGSGSAIGLRALGEALLLRDGRAEPTPLRRAVAARLPLGRGETVAWIERAGATGLAALAPLVVAEAEAGGADACAILDEAGAAIGGLLAALADRGAPRLSLIGGLAPVLSLRLGLAPAIAARLGPPLGDPLDGALALARLAAGVPLACTSAAG